MKISFNAIFTCNQCKSDFSIEPIYFLNKDTIECPSCGNRISKAHTEIFIDGIKKLSEFQEFTKDKLVINIGG